MAREGGKLFSDSTETLALDAKRERAPLAVVVTVAGARATPERLALAGGTCVVGSGPTCDLVIDEPSVSRSHVSLTLAPEGVLVEDLGSRNGTLYLGQRVQKMVLGLGSRLVVGRATLTLDADGAALQRAAAFPGDEYAGMVGRSAAMHQLFALLSRLEGSLVPVLLAGESGTGKELVARALHQRSQVAAGPFVAVNCGAFARELVASELFGHAKGAFTGAASARRGAFESAHGGTLFLDEIAELPLDAQPVLLRALEVGEVRPVGSDAVKKVRARVVAATHRDLRAEVDAGRFREDLYFRLAVVTVRIPPLRERPEDVELLALRFAAEVGLASLPPHVVARWTSDRWSGNVRELKNAVSSFAALGEPAGLAESSPATLEPALRDLADVARPYAEQKDALVEQFTRAYLVKLMAHTKGNQSAAARLAGLDRTYLGRLLVKHGLAGDER
ncbi:MAG: sigma 54-dependent Fis family transcriptional regulator [Myxococcales bacterium]|jgi:DNA-binding NtrC family response regulator|nr:sigma 54-dependent Fis family transcriptional regulator [Myxococcales bacterium]